MQSIVNLNYVECAIAGVLFYGICIYLLIYNKKGLIVTALLLFISAISYSQRTTLKEYRADVNNKIKYATGVGSITAEVIADRLLQTSYLIEADREQISNNEHEIFVIKTSLEGLQSDISVLKNTTTEDRRPNEYKDLQLYAVILCVLVLIQTICIFGIYLIKK